MTIPQSNKLLQKMIGLFASVRDFMKRFRKPFLSALKSKNLLVPCWEEVLADALHAMRSLLGTVTNCTPHETMFNNDCQSSTKKHLFPD